MTEQPYFHCVAVTNFLRVLQEATRATPAGNQSVFIPPVNGDKAEAAYHHLVFGQRGSGKSTLLRRLQQEKQSAGQLSVWVDQEIFSNLAFPDVLVSSVETVVRDVQTAVANRMTQLRHEVPLWRRPFWRHSRENVDLQSGLKQVEANLRSLKFAPLESTIEWTRSQKATTSAQLAGTVKIHEASASASGASALERSV